MQHSQLQPEPFQKLRSPVASLENTKDTCYPNLSVKNDGILQLLQKYLLLCIRQLTR